MTDFGELTFVRGTNRVVWEDIGEGLSGDYDPDDPLDVRLLRFYCDTFDQGWEEVDDASYCTLLPTSTPEAHLKIASERILDALEHGSYKRELQYLSWFDPSDFS